MPLEMNSEAAAVVSSSSNESTSNKSPMSSDSSLHTSHSPSEVLSGANNESASNNSNKANSTSTDNAPATLSSDEPKDKIGSKFAALSRKERQIYAMQQEAKTQQAAIASERAKMQAEMTSERAKIQAELKSIQEFNELKKMNPLKAVESLGFTVQQLNEMFLNDGKPTPEFEMQRVKSEMQAQLDAYKKEQEERSASVAKNEEERRKSQLEAEQNRIIEEQNQIIMNFRGEIGNFVKKNSEAYELTSLNDPEGNLVYSVVAEQFDKTGRVLSIKEASDLVESFYEQRVQENLATKKFKAKVSTQAGSSQPASQSNESRQQATNQSSASPANSRPITNTKTLTNNMASVSSSSSQAVMSEMERMQRALAALS